MILSCGGYPRISVPISSRTATIPTGRIFMITSDPSYNRALTDLFLRDPILRRLANTRTQTERKERGARGDRFALRTRLKVCLGATRACVWVGDLPTGSLKKSKSQSLRPHDTPAELLSLSDCAVVWRAVWRFHWLYTRA